MNNYYGAFDLLQCLYNNSMMSNRAASPHISSKKNKFMLRNRGKPLSVPLFSDESYPARPFVFRC